MTFLHIFFLISNSWAQVGSTTDALGGAGVGAAHAIESGWMNPASLGEFKGVYAGGQMFSGPVASGVDLEQYNATITDAETGMFPGALGYRFRKYDVAGTEIREHVFRYAAAYRVWENISVGGAAYRVNTDPPVGKNINQDNGDVGLYWHALPNLTIGAVTRGVLGSKDNIFGPSKVRSSGGLGAEYSALGYFKFRGDLNYLYEGNSDRRINHGVGVEILNREFMALRLGHNGDELRGESRYTAGIALDGPRLKAGYSYQKEYRQKLGESHTVDIWLSF